MSRVLVASPCMQFRTTPIADASLLVKSSAQDVMEAFEELLTARLGFQSSSFQRNLTQT